MCFEEVLCGQFLSRIEGLGSTGFAGEGSEVGKGGPGRIW